MAELSGFDSWKRARASEGRRGRRTRLALVGVLGLGTAAALLVALFQPFTAPDVHLFAVHLGATATADAVPEETSERPALRYTARDSAAFQRIAQRIHKYAPNHAAPQIGTAEKSTDVKSLGRQLLATASSSGHVLVLYLPSTGISIDGEAHLEWPSSEANAPPQRLRVADVLKQVRRSPAKIKLLLLDAGQRDFSLRDSSVVNEFTPRLKAAVEQTGDETLWVLASHSALETSHVSHRNRRSLFSLAVTDALNGAADRDGNGQIEIGELYRFVAANVSTNVRRGTGYYHTQTPVLCWGGGSATQKTMAVRLLPTLRDGDPGRMRRRRTIQDGDPGTMRRRRTLQDGDDENGDATKTALALFPADLTAKSAGTWVGSAGSRRSKTAIPTLPPVLAALSVPANSDSADLRKSPGAAAIRTAGTGQPADRKDAKAQAADPKTAKTVPLPAVTRRLRASGSLPAAKADAQPDAAETPASTPGNIPSRLAAAWLLRDRLTDRTTGSATPVDFAPHLWRRLETRLLQCERQYRIVGPFVAGESDDKTRPPVWPQAGLWLSRELDDVVQQMRAVGLRQPLDSPAVAALERDIAAFFAASQTPAVTPRTLGTAERLDAAAARTSAAELDRRLGGTMADFTAWAMKLSAAELEFAELHLARRLADATHLDWSDIRLALTARRYAEQVAAFAADEWDWVRDDLLAADRLQNHAERQLLDGIGGDYRQRFRRILARGVQRYAGVADRLRVLRAGRHAYGDAAYRAADVVRWHHATDFGPAGNGPSAQQVRFLLTTLSDLARRLDVPSRDHFNSVRRLTAALRGIQSDLAARSRDAVQRVIDRLLAGRGPLAGDRLRLETALRLPFIDGELRLKVLQAADRLARSPADPLTRDARDWHGPDHRLLSHDDWQKLLVRADIDVQLAEAAVYGSGPARPSGAGPRPPATGSPPNDMAAVRSSLHALRSASQNSGAKADSRWAAHRRLASALRKARSRLSLDLMNAAQTAGDVDGVLRRGRLLVELPPPAFNANDLIRRRTLQRAVQRVETALNRVQSALVDAPGLELRFLTSAGAGLRRDAARINAARKFPPPGGAAVEIQAPRSVSLIDASSETVAVRIRNLGTQPQSIKAVVEFDGRLVAVASESGTAGLLDRQSDSPSGKANAGRPALDSAWAAAAAAPLGASSAHILRLTLRRNDVRSSHPARLVVHVQADSQMVRQSTAILLPSVQSLELLVQTPLIDGARGRRAEGGRRKAVETPLTTHHSPLTTHGIAALHPFPNRTTGFQFRVRSLRRADRTVDVQVFVPDRALPALPLADLSPADFAPWRDRMGALKLLAEQKGLKVPGDGSPVRATLKPVGSATPAAKAAADAKPPAAARLDFGLLVVIREPGGGRIAVRPVKIAVQRPRRFVVPQVAFNAETRRLEIRVSPRNKSWLPAGPVAVQCEIVPRLPDGVEANLAGELTAQKDANLFAIVPEQLGTAVHVHVHVDGFPRDFVFRVPTDRSVESVSEDTTRQAVRLLVEEKSRLVSGAAPKIPVRIEVDAPVGSFQNGDDRVEIGVDAGRDRRLDGDVFRRLPSDREVSAAVEEITEDGTIVIRSTVADWNIDVPLKNYRNRKVDLLARLVAGTGSVFSNSVPVLADDRPPVIEPLRNLSTLEGQPLEISITSTDENLAGVEKVEVAVDPGTGQFSKDPPPSVASFGRHGRWEARIATDKLKPGRYQLLIRATDRAGNAGSIVKAPFLVLSKKDLEDRTQPKPSRVEGIVVWDGEAVPGATVTLTPQDSKKPAAIPPVTTDKNGEFQFPSVPPGKYVLTAKKAALANKNRTVDLSLTVRDHPETVPFQRVEFP